jgi:alginate O-acetyltransferase complex protein AlgJ
MSRPTDENLNPPPSAVRRWLDWILIGAFALLLLVPLVDLAFHVDPTKPPSENRVLAACPPAPENLGELKKFMAGWEAWFNDHFGFRRCLVMWHSKMAWSLFQDKNSRSVLEGEDGWLYITEPWMIEHFRGAIQFTDADLQAWQKLLEHRRDWLAARGIKFLFIVAPDKQTVYPEHLPPWLKNLGGRTKMDQFYDYMKKHSTVEVLDVRPRIIAGKTNAVTYMKTDTHWNQFGSFLACEEIVGRMRAMGVPDLPPLSEDDFIRTNRIAPGGDLVVLRGLKQSTVETTCLLMQPKPGLPKLDSQIPPVGPHAKDMATTKFAPASGAVDLFTDSFGRSWILFLGREFADGNYYWQYQLEPKRIEAHKPKIVICEMLERFFNVADPKQLEKQDALP